LTNRSSSAAIDGRALVKNGKGEYDRGEITLIHGSGGGITFGVDNPDAIENAERSCANTELVAPVRSEYWDDNHACHHIWLCRKCNACFESLVSFPTETEPTKDILTADPTLLPPLLVA
jgi:hypothetical protein